MIIIILNAPTSGSHMIISKYVTRMAIPNKQFRQMNMNKEQKNFPLKIINIVENRSSQQFDKDE